jgi:hypothetical protein
VRALVGHAVGSDDGVAHELETDRAEEGGGQLPKLEPVRRLHVGQLQAVNRAALEALV